GQCGRKTEVYSRITGYYRPVQNWNAGKAQEFRERKEYSVLERQAGPARSAAVMPQELVAAELGDGLYLFTSETCPNCRVACQMLDKAGAPYQVLLAAENRELALQYQVKQAPTLVQVVSGKADKYVGVPEIKRCLQALKVMA
ncbi:MAG: ribonucleoside triphosphate reductase, partial [Clostridiales bacterium]|nr:ribonucleoside triphosphate reductase [Clostridiales bacterium]